MTDTRNAAEPFFLIILITGSFFSCRVISAQNHRGYGVNFPVKSRTGRSNRKKLEKGWFPVFTEIIIIKIDQIRLSKKIPALHIRISEKIRPDQRWWKYSIDSRVSSCASTHASSGLGNLFARIVLSSNRTYQASGMTPGFGVNSSGW